MKTIKETKKETKKVSINLASKVRSNVPNYRDMIRLYGAQNVCAILNNL